MEQNQYSLNDVDEITTVYGSLRKWKALFEVEGVGRGLRIKAAEFLTSDSIPRYRQLPKEVRDKLGNMDDLELKALEFLREQTVTRAS